MSWAVVAATGVSVGGAYLGSQFGSKQGPSQTTTPSFTQLPEFEEAKGARGSMWDKLQQWGGQEGYGAVAPNWNDIWDVAKRRVSETFRGGPGGPGLREMSRAESARTGVTDSPAGKTRLDRLGMKESDLIYDMAINQSVEQAKFGETGRQNWMDQMTRLSGMKPSFATGSTTTSDPGGGNFMSMMPELGGAVGGNIQAGEQRGWLEDLLEKLGKGDSQPWGGGDIKSGDFSPMAYGIA